MEEALWNVTEWKIGELLALYRIHHGKDSLLQHVDSISQ